MEKQQVNTFSIKKIAIDTLLTLIASILSAFSLWIFVYPANFAPIGVDGIATMLYEITNVNAGYFSVLINAPLLICAWFILKRKYVVYTVEFTIFSAIILIVLEKASFYQYTAEKDAILSAIFSGFLMGVRTGIMLKMGASSGGMDVVGSMFQIKRPYIKIERIVSLICYAVVALSYLLYKDLNCILLSIIQMFVFERAVAFTLKDSRDAVELKIVTKNPQELKDDIIYNLKHGATILESKGMFTDENSFVVMSVVNTRQVPEFMKIIKKYPDTFVYYNDVSGVTGNFRWKKEDVAK